MISVTAGTRSRSSRGPNPNTISFRSLRIRRFTAYDFSPGVRSERTSCINLFDVLVRVQVFSVDPAEIDLCQEQIVDLPLQLEILPGGVAGAGLTSGRLPINYRRNDEFGNGDGVSNFDADGLSAPQRHSIES